MSWPTPFVLLQKEWANIAVGTDMGSKGVSVAGNIRPNWKSCPHSNRLAKLERLAEGLSDLACEHSYTKQADPSASRTFNRR